MSWLKNNAPLRRDDSGSIIAEPVTDKTNHQRWQGPRLELHWADAKLTVRKLFRSPVFTATTILTLALGIGANTGIFTLMHTLLLQSLPIPDPDSLVRVAMDIDAPNSAVHEMPLNLPLMQSIRRHAKSFSDVFGWKSYDFILKEDTGSHLHSGAIVSGNAFQALGVAPVVGRLLNSADDQIGGGADGWAAVISHRFWQIQFRSDPSVIGKSIMLSGHAVTIVGVTPPGFEGIVVGEHPDFYLPLEFEPVIRGSESTLRNPGTLWLSTWARLGPGISAKKASAEMNTLYKIAIDETLPAAVRHMPMVEKGKFVVRPGGTGWSDLRLQYTRPLILLQILVGIVLLVCCVNLAGLSLARAAAREQEFAIRMALGAQRSWVIQQLLLESIFLAILGGVLAVAFAWITDRYLLQFFGHHDAQFYLSVRPGVATLFLTGGSALLCALLFGVVPALLASRVSIEPALRRSERNALAGKNSKIRFLVVPIQIALTLALVVVASMLGESVVNLGTASLGFRTDNVLLVTSDFSGLPQKGDDLIDLYQKMLIQIEGQPGVINASIAENTPLNGRSHLGGFTSEDSSPGTDRAANKYEINEVGPHYFLTLGTELFVGRDFSGQKADTNTCILNRSAANALFPKASAIGRMVRQHIGSMNSGQTTTRDCEVIGIVQDAKYSSLREAAPPTIYFPFGSKTGSLSAMAFVIRARSLAEGTSAYRKILHELAPLSPEREPIAFSVQLKDSIARERLLSVLSSFFAALALLLSGIGIYGLMSSYVTRRTAEIGVRMALGATRTNILFQVMKQLGVLLLTGSLAGACLAFFAAHSIKAFLFDTSPNSLAIFVVSVLILALSGVAAALLPIRRAVSIQPVQALRYE